MREEALKARNMPSREAAFRNLHLNQRIDAAEHFITPDLWEGCGAAPDPEIFQDRDCWGGLDLSGKNDLTALVLVAQADDGVWDILPFFWAPGENLRQKEARDRAPYVVWRDRGVLEVTPGRVIDYRLVALKIKELLDEGFRLAGIKFDRWRSKDLRRELDAIGVDTWIYGEDWQEGDRGPRPDGLCLIPHGQGFKDMNPAVEVVEDLLMAQGLRHGNHPILYWCASNARIQSDPAGNRKFDKLKSTGRIDGLVALAMALNGAVTQEGPDADSIFSSGKLPSI
jgi:phage terminase large subunit-like protein